jgi:phosphohistidine phosphatase
LVVSGIGKLMARRSPGLSKSAKANQGKSLLEIFVLRHGEAGVRVDESGKDDARSLTRDGRTEIEAIASSLSGLGVELDLVVTSPLPRALQTAEIIARQFKVLNKLEQWVELKPLGEAESVYRRLSIQKARLSLLMVGHEPQLSGMIGEIVAGNSHVNLILKKGGLAKIEILGFKPRITGELRWLLTPRLMKKAGK